MYIHRPLHNIALFPVKHASAGHDCSEYICTRVIDPLAGSRRIRTYVIYVHFIRSRPRALTKYIYIYLSSYSSVLFSLSALSPSRAGGCCSSSRTRDEGFRIIQLYLKGIKVPCRAYLRAERLSRINSFARSFFVLFFVRSR